ncbi:MAG: NAD(P)H dehydrogenase (quinone), Type IV [uncultured Rubrobacteraceae bacterium]|uniref:NAD(P)H dehydrogenase (Quinone), Type IV n=1 Tax=uncultured Rubrobacteraceae bacterium TaxID=349277 RepID=A0A6J4THY6_9ACTN|nr:MAG: NAD(P)H dehydrogenase (quinone), Type IV [uncultured Rubrobacteraceae bacterium]
MATKVAVIYYSATGNVFKLAQAVEEGAKEAGAEVRFRKVHELAPEEAIKSNQGWSDHALMTEDVPEADLADLEWADAYIFGTPTRFGNVSAQLKQFIDTAGGLWFEGKLADKVASGFTSASNPHGGQESTLLSLYNVFAHWGSIVVTPGYTDPLLFEAGGNPYGASSTNEPNEQELAAARYLGRRVAEKAALLTGSRV